MAAATKIRREHTDELDTALASISNRWRGNLASYLEALARAKEAAAAESDDEGRIRTALETTRLIRRR
jgi:hypothetical protein